LPASRIEYLADHPDLIPTLAEWHHEQFSYLSPGSSVERCAAHLLAQRGRSDIPTTVIALAGDQLLGSASLVTQDMDIRPQLSPWLASVYVAPEYRRRGIGSSLVRRIAGEATALGVERLHLYTPDKESFYLRLGWHTLEHNQYRGHLVAVMALDLVEGPASEPTGGEAGEEADPGR
jgi:GNAT superfamily N-acetyltransferase